MQLSSDPKLWWLWQRQWAGGKANREDVVMAWGCMKE